MSSTRSKPPTLMRKSSSSSTRTREHRLLEDKICCYGTNHLYIPQSCIVAEGTIRVLEIDKVCLNISTQVIHFGVSVVHFFTIEFV